MESNYFLRRRIKVGLIWLNFLGVILPLHFSFNATIVIPIIEPF